MAGAEMNGTTVETLLRRAELHPERVAIRTLASGGADRDGAITWGELSDAARAFGTSLIAAGHREGERVAILAGNRAIWPIADLGILLAGGVSVGIYPTSSPGQVAHVIADSGAVVTIVDGADQLAKLLSVRAGLPDLRVIVCQDASGAGVIGWAEWLEDGLAARTSAAAAEREARTARLDPRSDALLIYTSGSTGEPKGARVSHGYLTASAASIGAVLGLTDQDSSLSFLPFCHAAERVFGLHTRIVFGMTMGLVPDHEKLWAAARDFGPTIFGGVPRFFEKVWEELERERRHAPPAERERLYRALELGRRRSRLRRAGRAIPLDLEREWVEAGGAAARRLRDHFGGRVRLATSGGASFPHHVAEDLDALGLTVLGAYGLTEHLCVAFNRPDRYTFDSAGPAMPGTEIRLADDGEILIRRSALTFSGYHDRPEETAAAFSPDGEWLLTGDLGTLEGDGLLRVTGRKKELIALSTGKKVAPLPIESQLGSHPWIDRAVVIGEGRKYLSAIITLRCATVTGWAASRELDLSYAELLSHPDVLAEVQRAVDAANEALSRPERVRRFVLLDHGFTVEAEELTPTLKVRRGRVAERYRDELNALYMNPEP
jgi:long-chain acyl-CoA synthetase